MQKELRRPIVSRRAQKPVTSTDAMPASQLFRCLLGDSLPRRVPLVIPAIKIAGDNPLGRGQHLAKLAAAITAGSEGALRLKPELKVVRKNRWLCLRGMRIMRWHTWSFIHHNPPVHAVISRARMQNRINTDGSTNTGYALPRERLPVSARYW